MLSLSEKDCSLCGAKNPDGSFFLWAKPPSYIKTEGFVLLYHPTERMVCGTCYDQIVAEAKRLKAEGKESLALPPED